MTDDGIAVRLFVSHAALTIPLSYYVKCKWVAVIASYILGAVAVYYLLSVRIVVDPMCGIPVVLFNGFAIPDIVTRFKQKRA
jgi:hypothetical protein